MAGTLTTPALRRLVNRPAATAPAPAPAPLRPAGQERCDLCSEILPPGHRHLLDLPTDTVNCACRACSLLFDRQEAGAGHYRLLPDRRLRLDGFDLDEMLWAALGIPVDLAFVVRGGSGEVTARYPSPLGTLRARVEQAAWQEIEQRDPLLLGMEDDVEALLVDRTGGGRRYWLLPLDDCYRLAAVVRTRWQGIGGGPEVRLQIERFFEELPLLPPTPR